jgi:hypothetical protein
MRAYGSPVAEAGPVAAKRQKTARGRIPRVSANLDGARRCTNPPRLATAKAATGAKGPEVIPSDEDDEFLDEGTSTVTSMQRKVRKAMPGKAAKNLFKAPPDEARDFAVEGAPATAPLTMDGDDAYVKDTTSNAGSKPRSTAVAAARARAPANHVLVSSQVAASLCTERASGDPWEVGGAVPARDEPDNRTHRLPNNWKVRKVTPGKAAKNFGKAPSNEARDFAVEGAPTTAPLMMDDNDAYVEDTTSNAGSKPRSTAAVAAHARAIANNVR